MKNSTAIENDSKRRLIEKQMKTIYRGNKNLMKIKKKVDAKKYWLLKLIFQKTISKNSKTYQKIRYYHKRTIFVKLYTGNIF